MESVSFQLEAWNAYLNGQNGLVNAPTGAESLFIAGSRLVGIYA